MQNGKYAHDTAMRRLYAMERGVRFRRNVLSVASMALSVYITVSSQAVREGVLATLRSCASKLVPSLMPFMIASRLLVSCGFGEGCARVFSRPFSLLFGLGGSGAGAFLLGAAAGFPVGAKNVCELKDSGACTEREAEALLGLCSNPGIGFCVAFIGMGLWKSAVFGLRVWLTAVLSSVLAGVLVKRDAVVIPRENVLKKDVSKSDVVISSVLVGAVTDAVSSMLYVCGFVIFFELLAGAVVSLVGALPCFDGAARDVIDAVFTAFLEFSSGTVKLAELAGRTPAEAGAVFAAALGRVMTVAAVTWSGVSVHMQVAAFALPRKLKMSGYYRVKALATLISAVIAMAVEVIIGA